MSHIENWPPLHNSQPDEYSWLNFVLAYNWLICHSILVWLSRLISTRPRTATKNVQRSQRLYRNNSSTIVYVATVLTKITGIDFSSVSIIILAILRLFLRLGLAHGNALWDCYGDSISSLIGYYKIAQETASQNSPIVQFNTTQTQFLAQIQNIQVAVACRTGVIFSCLFRRARSKRYARRGLRVSFDRKSWKNDACFEARSQRLKPS